MNHFIVDGYGLAFRSFYAFNNLSTKAGVPSGCVYGFISTMRSLRKKYPGNHVTIAWDNEARRKKSVFADYKANRPKTMINDQIMDLKKIFSFVNVTQAEMPEEEADDVIASLAKNYSEEGLVSIYSSDKDMLQLVRDGKVIVIRPKTGGIPDEIYDEEAVKREFGIPARDFACYQAFRGDPSDNIPGVARVPSKVIIEVIGKCRSYGMDNFPAAIYLSDALTTLTEFQKKSFLAHQAQSDINYDLVRLRDDLKYEAVDGIPDPIMVGSVMDRYEIRSMSPDTFVDMFSDTSAFSMRRSPQIENVSLF